MMIRSEKTSTSQEIAKNILSDQAKKCGIDLDDLFAKHDGTFPDIDILISEFNTECFSRWMKIQESKNN